MLHVRHMRALRSSTRLLLLLHHLVLHNRMLCRSRLGRAPILRQINCASACRHLGIVEAWSIGHVHGISGSARVHGVHQERLCRRRSQNTVFMNQHLTHLSMLVANFLCLYIDSTRFLHDQAPGLLRAGTLHVSLPLNGSSWDTPKVTSKCSHDSFWLRGRCAVRTPCR